MPARACPTEPMPLSHGAATCLPPFFGDPRSCIDFVIIRAREQTGSTVPRRSSCMFFKTLLLATNVMKAYSLKHIICHPVCFKRLLLLATNSTSAVMCLLWPVFPSPCCCPTVPCMVAEQGQVCFRAVSTGPGTQ